MKHYILLLLLLIGWGTAQAQQQPEMDLPETNRDVFQAED